jgi:hypothetical protein
MGEGKKGTREKEKERLQRKQIDRNKEGNIGEIAREKVEKSYRVR